MEPHISEMYGWDGIQVMAAREKGGSPEGLYLAAKGGHNAESHNHNDVGSCIMFVDGLPGIIDVGWGSIPRKPSALKGMIFGLCSPSIIMYPQ